VAFGPSGAVETRAARRIRRATASDGPRRGKEVSRPEFDDVSNFHFIEKRGET